MKMVWAFKTLIRQCFSNFSHLKEIHKKREENHEKDQNTKKYTKVEKTH